MTDIHSCSYYCARPGCIKAQRDELRERLAQPEPEPVAWLDGPHLVVRLDMRNRLNYQGPWVDLGRAIPDKWTPFLYTAPPQRKPLTDGELADLWYKQSTDWMEFGRAIEAAHGIKES